MSAVNNVHYGGASMVIFMFACSLTNIHKNVTPAAQNLSAAQNEKFRKTTALSTDMMY